MYQNEKVTKAQVLKLAQKKHGKNTRIEQNPHVPDEVAKAVLREQSRQQQERRKALDAERKALVAQGNPRKALREAARFALDVDGDEPSWTQLREAVEREERLVAITEEIRELDEAARNNGGVFSAYRWRVTRLVNVAGILMNHIHEEADTLEELKAKLLDVRK